MEQDRIQIAFEGHGANRTMEDLALLDGVECEPVSTEQPKDFGVLEAVAVFASISGVSVASVIAFIKKRMDEARTSKETFKTTLEGKGLRFVIEADEADTAGKLRQLADFLEKTQSPNG